MATMVHFATITEKPAGPYLRFSKALDLFLDDVRDATIPDLDLRWEFQKDESTFVFCPSDQVERVKTAAQVAAKALDGAGYQCALI